MATSPIRPRVLLVTRSGAAATGGGLGHSVSTQYHADALDLAERLDHVVPLPDGGRLSRKVRTFMRLRHGHLAGVHHGVISTFEHELLRVQPHAVFFDSAVFGPLATVAKRHGCKVFTQTHNCEYDYYAGVAALRGGLAGELLKAAYNAEREAITASDVVFALSAYDRQRLSQLYDGVKDCRVVNPHVHRLAAKLDRNFTASVPPLERKRSPPVAVFLGSAGHQNQLACELLLRHWSGDQARLQIVGKVGDSLRETRRASALDAHGIEFLGFVDSLEELLPTATAMVCPMYLGSGIKVKIVEALANACPVLASAEAMHGFEFARDSGWIRECALNGMEEGTVSLRYADLSIERLSADVRRVANLQAALLRETYAAHGLATTGERP